MEFPKEKLYDPLKVPKHSPIGRGRTTSMDRQNLAFQLYALVVSRLPNNYDPAEYTISCGNEAYFALKWFIRASIDSSKFKHLTIVRNSRTKDPRAVLKSFFSRNA